MRGYILLAAGAALMATTAGAAANAADTAPPAPPPPSEAPAPPPDPEGTIGYGVYEYWDWAGIYAGVQGGWVWGEDEAFEFDAFPGPFGDDGPLPYDTESYAVGGVLGINMQVGRWVYGGELDVEYTDISGRFDWLNDDLEPNGNFLTKEIGILGSLRARFGYAIDRFLIYGTGGAAAGHLEMQTVDGPPPLDRISDTQTEFGWTAGGGFEIELWDNWSAGAEYRYTDLGESEFNGIIFRDDDDEIEDDRFTYTHTNRFHAVRARLIWRMHI